MSSPYLMTRATTLGMPFKTLPCLTLAPQERMMSMYWWLRQKQVTCCSPADFGWNGGKEWFSVIMKIARGHPPQEALGQFTGCQLHMLMGHRCCSRHVYQQPIAEVLRAAKGRIDELFFVGLTSEWHLSVCLFNYKMTGVRYVTAQQVTENAPTTGTFVTTTCPCHVLRSSIADQVTWHPSMQSTKTPHCMAICASTSPVSRIIRCCFTMSSTTRFTRTPSHASIASCGSIT